MTRREAREQAFLVLFEWSFREKEPVQEAIELAFRCRGAELDDFARKLTMETAEYVHQIDQEIQGYSDKWKLNRLSKATLAVLRMGICEMSRMQGIPAGATINEAVELMKKYATEDEAAYVNGVLGAYHRGKEQGKVPDPTKQESESKAPEEL